MRSPMSYLMGQFFGALLRRANTTQHDREHPRIALDRLKVRQIGASDRRQHQPRRAQDPERIHVSLLSWLARVPGFDPGIEPESVAIAWIDAVEEAKIRGPFSRCPPPVMEFILCRDVLADLRG